MLKVSLCHLNAWVIFETACIRAACLPELFNNFIRFAGNIWLQANLVQDLMFWQRECLARDEDGAAIAEGEYLLRGPLSKCLFTNQSGIGAVVSQCSSQQLGCTCCSTIDQHRLQCSFRCLLPRLHAARAVITSQSGCASLNVSAMLPVLVAVKQSLDSSASQISYRLTRGCFCFSRG